jgi:hypothetical protein
MAELLPARGHVVVEIGGKKAAKKRLKIRAKYDILRLRLIQRLCGAVDLVEFG